MWPLCASGLLRSKPHVSQRSFLPGNWALEERSFGAFLSQTVLQTGWGRGGSRDPPPGTLFSQGSYSDLRLPEIKGAFEADPEEGDSPPTPPYPLSQKESAMSSVHCNFSQAEFL